MTMTDEDAQSQLIAQAGRSLQFPQQERLQIQPDDENTAPNENGDKSPELRAMPSTIRGVTPHKARVEEQSVVPVPAKITTTNKNKIKAKVSSILSKHLPGIGDDFYLFEQFYGHALEFQAGNGKPDLTWTHYPPYAPAHDPPYPPLIDVFAGSRNASKVDVIIITLPADANPKEGQLLSLVRSLTHSSKQQPIAPFAHSVRYLSNGRSEIMTTAIRDFRILSFKIHGTNGQSDKVVLAVSRLPGDLETAVSNYSKQVDFLNILQECI